MPKANKHAEVKPSKFKTTLCQFYSRQEECPFGARCAFAHGEHEIQTEERNVELLKVTGLQRLDGTPAVVSTSNALCAESSLAASLLPAMNTTRRRTVMVSLPKWAATDATETSSEAEEGMMAVSALRTVPRASCTSRFSANCSRENTLMYRHNPYGLSTQYH